MEPVAANERPVVKNGGSLTVRLTKELARLGVSLGDKVRVLGYDDRIEIWKVGAR